MIMKHGFLLLILLCWPFVSRGDVDVSSISTASDIPGATQATKTLVENLGGSADQTQRAQEQLDAAIEKAEEPANCDPDEKPDDAAEKAARLKAAEEKYNEAHENEQSMANKTLTAITTAATGIGGMELAMGLAEQAADANADMSMGAYIETFRCTYADGKTVKAGPEEIELPGGNDQTLMNLRTQYFALATSLKERKEALGLKPGIESEVIMDKFEMGLYDDESVGITNGAYESLYRAKMLDSETDQAKIDDAAETSKKRVMGGAIALGAGAVVGVAGNMLINSDSIKEKISELKEKRDERKETRALNKLKKCLQKGGATNTDNLTFTKFKPSTLSVDKINCDSEDWKKVINKRSAQELFTDTDDQTAFDTIMSNFTTSDNNSIANTLLGIK